jgi:aspartyl-tRNA(Asn)/glutamyl-tRNA(Gln) amidotransferase subunit A
VTDFGTDLESGVDGLRIAYSRNLGYADVDADVAALVDDAAAWFDRAGAVVEEADPGFADPIDIMVTLWSVALALAIEPLTVNQKNLVDPPVLDIAERGFATSAVSFRQAERARDALGRHMQLFHADYDLLITPQLPITAFAAGREVPEGRAMTRWWEWSPFTYPFNLTQQPAASLPCGFTAAGLPAALQVVGARFADAMVLRACRAYVAEHPFVMPESGD